MTTARDTRLAAEFARMKQLLAPHSMVSFQCADLSTAEATEFLKPKMSSEVITKGLPGFLPPEQFEQQFPGQAPAKYLIAYCCKGLMKEDSGEEAKETDFHRMEVVFGWDYPSKRPIFIWATPIWHPNFDPPYICIEGRPFAIGLTLDRVVIEVGRMIQYQNYNVADPLNQEAANWARNNANRFPVDNRDLLDNRQQPGTKFKERLVELVDHSNSELLRDPDGLIDLIDPNTKVAPRPD